MRVLLHLLCFALPLYTSLYVWSGPHAHPWPWLLMVPMAVGLDAVASAERRPPAPNAPAWLFDAALYGLSLIHLVNLAGYVHMALDASWTERAISAFLVGASSGYSAIVVAHELVHRKSRHMQLLGRLLVGTVLYTHFAVEHVRGHHKRVGTPDDPATARYGERLWPFLLRTVPGQLRSAWRIEAKRLGDEEMSLFDRRSWRNEILLGKLAEWGVVLVLGLTLGPIAALAWAWQAAWAVLLLETVNYVEHWGLVRRGVRVETTDSWDSESWFTYYTLVGLSRHADHHAHASRPWQDLRCFDASPKMPWGYWTTVIGSLVANRYVMGRMKAELDARRAAA